MYHVLSLFCRFILRFGTSKLRQKRQKKKTRRKNVLQDHSRKCMLENCSFCVGELECHQTFNWLRLFLPSPSWSWLFTSVRDLKNQILVSLLLFTPCMTCTNSQVLQQFGIGGPGMQCAYALIQYYLLIRFDLHVTENFGLILKICQGKICSVSCV